MYRLIKILFLSLLSLATLGCGSSAYDINSVTGVVTMDGKPLPNARVTFTPQDGRPSYGISDESGRYELRYIRDILGAEVGQHTVAITTEYEAPPITAPPMEQPPETIPPRYNRATTLTADVQAGSNEFNFDLESKKN